MIIGTAGHIDHGKTTLVRALTGVDTDRLPEERRRGISIELGYAFLDAPDGTRLAFIDVPGHERLVHTMLSGATGMDHALLLVAAEDGVMPQTREHFAILELLAVPSASFVITKTDRADPPQRERVREQLAALAAGTRFAEAPIFQVSAQTGEGIAALRDALLSGAEHGSRETTANQGFRIAIDRVFVVEGAGTVVSVVCGPQVLKPRHDVGMDRPQARAIGGKRFIQHMNGFDLGPPRPERTIRRGHRHLACAHQHNAGPIARCGRCAHSGRIPASFTTFTARVISARSRSASASGPPTIGSKPLACIRLAVSGCASTV